MYGTNPFSTQAAWNASNQSDPLPSIFGAVVGPSNETSCRVVTDPALPGYTVLKMRGRQTTAVIEWGSPPNVDARGVVAKPPVRQWLTLASDRRSRYSMVFDGATYSWAPLDKFLQLSAAGATDWLARVSRPGYDAIVLELTPQAIGQGLIDTSTLATIILQCGANID